MCKAMTRHRFLTFSSILFVPQGERSSARAKVPLQSPSRSPKIRRIQGAFKIDFVRIIRIIPLLPCSTASSPSLQLYDSFERCIQSPNASHTGIKLRTFIAAPPFKNASLKFLSSPPPLKGLPSSPIQFDVFHHRPPTILSSRSHTFLAAYPRPDMTSH